tara:strand:+ start:5343 stop:5702 length:360 start_codon:yes stop_codon:yes gene_type:complete
MYTKTFDIHEQLNSLFNFNEADFIAKPDKGWYSTKTEKGLVLELAVPGFTKKDLKIKMVKGDLSIVSTNEDNKWLGSFEKLFTIPNDVDSKKVNAKVENGVLTLTLPIKEDKENFIVIT